VCFDFIVRDHTLLNSVDYAAFTPFTGRA